MIDDQIELIKKIINTKDLTGDTIVYKGDEYLAHVNRLNHKLTITFSYFKGTTVGAIHYDYAKDKFSRFNSNRGDIKTKYNFQNFLQDYEEMDSSQFILTYGKDPLSLSPELYDMLNIFISDQNKQTPKSKGFFDSFISSKFLKFFTERFM